METTTNIIQLLTQIDILHNRKQNIEKLLNLINDNILYVYTSGLADENRKNHWNNFLLPWLKQLNKQLYIFHYDNWQNQSLNNDGEIILSNIIQMESNNNYLINEFLQFDNRYINSYISYDKPINPHTQFNKLLTHGQNYVYFDFAHLLNHTIELPYNYIYYVYEMTKIDIECFKPFRYENNKIITFIQDLKKINNSDKITIKKLKLSNENTTKFLDGIETIMMNNVTFKNQEKLGVLYWAIVEFNLKDLSKLLGLLKFNGDLNDKKYMFIEGSIFKDRLVNAAKI